MDLHLKISAVLGVTISLIGISTVYLDISKNMKKDQKINVLDNKINTKYTNNGHIFYK